MVSGCDFVGCSCGTCIPPSEPTLAHDAGEVYFAGSNWPGALANLQRHRLPQSAGVRERPVLGQSYRAKDRDSKSGARQSDGCRLVFSEGGRIECERVELAGEAVACLGVTRKLGNGVQRAGTSCIISLGSAAFLCFINSVWERTNFCSHVVAVFKLQRALRTAIASSVRDICPAGDLFHCPVCNKDRADCGFVGPLARDSNITERSCTIGCQLHHNLACRTDLLSRS